MEISRLGTSSRYLTPELRDRKPTVYGYQLHTASNLLHSAGRKERPKLIQYTDLTN